MGTSEAGDALSSRSPSGTLDALLPAGSSEAGVALQTQLPPWLSRHSTGTSASLPAPMRPDGPQAGGPHLFRTLSDSTPAPAMATQAAFGHRTQEDAGSGEDQASLPEPPVAAPISLPASSPFAPQAQVPLQTPHSGLAADDAQSGLVCGQAPINAEPQAATQISASPVADSPWTGADDHRSPSLGGLPPDTPGTDGINLYSRGREVSIGPMLSTEVAMMTAGSSDAATQRDAVDAAPAYADTAAGSLPETAAAPLPELAVRVGSGENPGLGQPQGGSLDMDSGGGQALGAMPLPDSPMQSVSSPASRTSSRRSQSGEIGSLRSRLYPRSVIGKVAGALSFGHRSPTLDPLTTNGVPCGATDSPTAAQLRRGHALACDMYVCCAPAGIGHQHAALLLGSLARLQTAQEAVSVQVSAFHCTVLAENQASSQQTALYSLTHGCSQPCVVTDHLCSARPREKRARDDDREQDPVTPKDSGTAGGPEAAFSFPVTPPSEPAPPPTAVFNSWSSFKQSLRPRGGRRDGLPDGGSECTTDDEGGDPARWSTLSNKSSTGERALPCQAARHA